MSDTPPPPPHPGQGQQVHSPRGSTDVWGDDTHGRVGFGNRHGWELFAWIVSASILCLGYLWMIWDDDRQTWPDKVAGTSVVRSR